MAKASCEPADSSLLSPDTHAPPCTNRMTGCGSWPVPFQMVMFRSLVPPPDVGAWAKTEYCSFSGSKLIEARGYWVLDITHQQIK